MRWDSGCLEYENLANFLHVIMRDVIVIYVKGLDKKKLKKILGGKKNIVEMEEALKCPASTSIELLYSDHSVKCSHHDRRADEKFNDY